MRIIVGTITMTMKTTQMKTNKETQHYIREILPSAYWKVTKTIMSCTAEEQLEVCLRMIENYERLMLNFYLTSSTTKEETKASAIDLLSLIKIKRKQIRRH